MDLENLIALLSAGVFASTAVFALYAHVSSRCQSQSDVNLQLGSELRAVEIIRRD